MMLQQKSTTTLGVLVLPLGGLLSFQHLFQQAVLQKAPYPVGAIGHQRRELSYVCRYVCLIMYSPQTFRVFIYGPGCLISSLLFLI